MTLNATYAEQCLSQLLASLSVTALAPCMTLLAAAISTTTAAASTTTAAVIAIAVATVVTIVIVVLTYLSASRSASSTTSAPASAEPLTAFDDFLLLLLPPENMLNSLLAPLNLFMCTKVCVYRTLLETFHNQECKQLSTYSYFSYLTAVPSTHAITTTIQSC